MDELLKIAGDHWQVLATIGGFIALLVVYRPLRAVAKKLNEISPRGWAVLTLLLAGVYFLCWWRGPAYHINDQIKIVERDTAAEGKIGVIRDWDFGGAEKGYRYHVDCGEKGRGVFSFQEIERLEGYYIPSVPSLVVISVCFFLVILMILYPPK